MSVKVFIKHSGKVLEVQADLEQSAAVLKKQIYEVTGVPTERMKVMISGKLLKDDTDLSKMKIGEGQTLTVIGTAGPLPQAPSQPVAFLEDIESGQVSAMGQQPPGLVNLGNSCYLAASIQALKSVPELQKELEQFSPANSAAGNSTSGRLTSSLKSLVASMNTSTEPVAPLGLLAALRSFAPQFSEMSEHGGYAQQDADECWGQVLSALRSSLKPLGSTSSFIDEHFSANLQQTLTCDEAPDEPATTKDELIYKLDCNIDVTTNYMVDGIKQSFDQKIEKNSPTLGRSAIYTQKSTLSRLPSALTVHMVRFFWRADIQKKVKILRRCKFSMDFDVSDLLTEDLKGKLQPVNLAMKEIDKSRVQRARVARKTKKAVGAAPGQTDASGSTAMDVEQAEDDEETIRARERREIDAMIEKQGPMDRGANHSGLYELAAIVSHKGASADSGHYIGWSRKPTAPDGIPGEEDWWKFDDDKVSTVSKESLQQLEGGGEASVAYILVYRSKTV